MSTASLDRYNAVVEEARDLLQVAGILAAHHTATRILEQQGEASWLVFEPSGGEVEWFEIHDANGAVVSGECQVDPVLLMSIYDAGLSILGDDEEQILDLERAVRADEADIAAGVLLSRRAPGRSVPSFEKGLPARRAC